jgi:hypothetical protein
MTAPFVSTLRARPDTVVLGAGFGALVLRVEMPERWDVVRVTAQPGESVLAVKVAALAVLIPGADHRRWVMKLRGIEIADSETLLEATARSGSTFLITHRRRRPVR